MLRRAVLVAIIGFIFLAIGIGVTVSVRACGGCDCRMSIMLNIVVLIINYYSDLISRTVGWLLK